jgi:hypothetical protein
MASQIQQVYDLVRKLEPQIQKAFLDAVARSIASVDKKALIEALKRGDVEAAAQLVKIETNTLFPLQEAVRSGYVSGGISVRAELPKAIAGQFGFDGRAYRAQQWMNTEGASLVQGISDDSVVMARSLISSGLENGTSPLKIASQLTGRVVAGQHVGGFIGLTSQMETSITNGRFKLASGDPALMAEYLQLKLRQTRFDGMIKRAIKRGEGLKGDDLERVIEAHKVKALRYRGKTIAENESFTSMSAGRDEGYRQVLDKPGIERVDVTWQHNLSAEPRIEHLSLSSDKAKRTIRLGEFFEFSRGIKMKHPHDPSGGARHSVHCRCIALYRIIVKKA